MGRIQYQNIMKHPKRLTNNVIKFLCKKKKYKIIKNLALIKMSTTFQSLHSIKLSVIQSPFNFINT